MRSAGSSVSGNSDGTIELSFGDRLPCVPPRKYYNKVENLLEERKVDDEENCPPTYKSAGSKLGCMRVQVLTDSENSDDETSSSDDSERLPQECAREDQGCLTYSAKSSCVHGGGGEEGWPHDESEDKIECRTYSVTSSPGADDRAPNAELDEWEMSDWGSEEPGETTPFHFTSSSPEQEHPPACGDSDDNPLVCGDINDIPPEIKSTKLYRTLISLADKSLGSRLKDPNDELGDIIRKEFALDTEVWTKEIKRVEDIQTEKSKRGFKTADSEPEIVTSQSSRTKRSHHAPCQQQQTHQQWHTATDPQAQVKSDSRMSPKLANFHHSTGGTERQNRGGITDDFPSTRKYYHLTYDISDSDMTKSSVNTCFKEKPENSKQATHCGRGNKQPRVQTSSLSLGKFDDSLSSPILSSTPKLQKSCYANPMPLHDNHNNREGVPKKHVGSNRNDAVMSPNFDATQSEENHCSINCQHADNQSHPGHCCQGESHDILEEISARDISDSFDKQIQQNKIIMDRLRQSMGWMSLAEHDESPSPNSPERLDHGDVHSLQNQEGDQNLNTATPVRPKIRKPGSPMRRREQNCTPARSTVRSTSSPVKDGSRKHVFCTTCKSESNEPGKEPSRTPHQKKTPEVDNTSSKGGMTIVHTIPGYDSEEESTTMAGFMHSDSTPIVFRNHRASPMAKYNKTKRNSNVYSGTVRSYDASTNTENIDIGYRARDSILEERTSSQTETAQSSSDSDSFSIHIRVHRKKKGKRSLKPLKMAIAKEIENLVRNEGDRSSYSAGNLSMHSINERENQACNITQQNLKRNSCSTHTRCDDSRSGSRYYERATSDLKIMQNMPNSADNVEGNRRTIGGVPTDLLKYSIAGTKSNTEARSDTTDSEAQSTTCEITHNVERSSGYRNTPTFTVPGIQPPKSIPAPAPKHFLRYAKTRLYKTSSRDSIVKLLNGERSAGIVKNSPQLFDVRRFDRILEDMFPSKDASIVYERRTEEVSCPDSDTPQELLKITEPPAIGYADNEWVIHHSTDLYKQLADSEETDSILPLQIPFLKSYDYKYATTSEGRPIDIGWSGSSQVFLGFNRLTNKFVVIKVKPWDTAVHEARLLMFLRDIPSIPQFYGLLCMTDNQTLGLVCQLIKDEHGDDTRSKDVGAMLSFDRGHATRLNLTPYQWLDVCIAICKIVIDIHEHGALANDISLYNILIRREGSGYVPYLVDLSSAQLSMNSTAASYEGRNEESLQKSFKHVAPEVLSGEVRTEASDIFSLLYIVGYIQKEVRIKVNPIVTKGLSLNTSKRPTARQVMNELINQRSHYDVKSLSCEAQLQKKSKIKPKCSQE